MQHRASGCSSSPAAVLLKDSGPRAASVAASTGVLENVHQGLDHPVVDQQSSGCRDAPWCTLPDSVVGHILQYLHDEEKCLLSHPAGVCRQWRRVAFEVLLYDTAASRPGRPAPAVSRRGDSRSAGTVNPSQQQHATTQHGSRDKDTAPDAEGPRHAGTKDAEDRHAAPAGATARGSNARATYHHNTRRSTGAAGGGASSSRRSPRIGGGRRAALQNLPPRTTRRGTQHQATNADGAVAGQPEAQDAGAEHAPSAAAAPGVAGTGHVVLGGAVVEAQAPDVCQPGLARAHDIEQPLTAAGAALRPQPTKSHADQHQPAADDVSVDHGAGHHAGVDPRLLAADQHVPTTAHRHHGHHLRSSHHHQQQQPAALRVAGEEVAPAVSVGHPAVVQSVQAEDAAHHAAPQHGSAGAAAVHGPHAPTAMMPTTRIGTRAAAAAAAAAAAQAHAQQAAVSGRAGPSHKRSRDAGIADDGLRLTGVEAQAQASVVPPARHTRQARGVAAAVDMGWQRQGHDGAASAGGARSMVSVGVGSVGEGGGAVDEETLQGGEGDRRESVAGEVDGGGGVLTPASITMMNNAGNALGPGEAAVDQEASMGMPVSSTRAQLHVTAAIEPMGAPGDAAAQLHMMLALPDHDDDASNVGQPRTVQRRTHRRTAAASRYHNRHAAMGHGPYQQDMDHDVMHVDAAVAEHEPAEAIEGMAAAEASVSIAAGDGLNQPASHFVMHLSQALSPQGAEAGLASPVAANDHVMAPHLQEALSIGPAFAVAPASLTSVEYSGTSSEVGPLAAAPPDDATRSEGAQGQPNGHGPAARDAGTARQTGGGAQGGAVAMGAGTRRHGSKRTAAGWHQAANGRASASHAIDAPREDQTVVGGGVGTAAHAENGGGVLSWQDGQEQAGEVQPVHGPAVVHHGIGGGGGGGGSATVSDASWGMWGNSVQRLQEWVRGPQTRMHRT